MSKKLILPAAVVVVLVMCLGVWFFLRHRNTDGDAAATVATPAPVVTPSPAADNSGPFAGISLATADPVLRKLAAELSSRPELAQWLLNEDLIRRFVAAVDNIGRGKDPRVHLEFLKPVGAFRVRHVGEKTFIDPLSYRRYDTIADVVASLDTEGLTRLYRDIKPLLEEADREISPPGESFDAHLRAAIDELLAVPVPEGDVEVKAKVVTWLYADPALEGLSPAQRHLLRMGGENIRKIQAKLREIKAALEL